MSELAERVDAVLYPLLRISAKGEGTPEHEIQHCHHDREAEPRVREDLIDLLQAGLVGVIRGMGEGLGEDTVDVGAVSVLVALVAEVVDRVRRRKRLSRCVFYQRQALLQTIVLAHRHTAGGYTDELLKFGDIERVIGLEQEVVPSDGDDDLLMLVDDMRGEEERLLESRGVHQLQDDVVGMTVQLVGVMHLRELQGEIILVRQVLEGRGESGFAALRQSYDSDFGHSGFKFFCGCKSTAFLRHTQYLIMGIFEGFLAPGTIISRKDARKMHRERARAKAPQT